MIMLMLIQSQQNLAYHIHIHIHRVTCGDCILRQTTTPAPDSATTSTAFTPVLPAVPLWVAPLVWLPWQPVADTANGPIATQCDYYLSSANVHEDNAGNISGRALLFGN